MLDQATTVSYFRCQGLVLGRAIFLQTGVGEAWFCALTGSCMCVDGASLTCTAQFLEAADHCWTAALGLGKHQFPTLWSEASVPNLVVHKGTID